MENKKFDYANKMIHMEKQLHCGRKQFETRNFLKVCFMVCFILVLSFGRNSQAQHTVQLSPNVCKYLSYNDNDLCRQIDEKGKKSVD